MNHSYRLVWNDSTQRYVAAPETARGRGKSRAAKALAPAALLLGALLASTAGAQALPTGGQVVSGQAVIGQAGSQMTITQQSPKAILHWQGFDIGSGGKVQFNQPGASAIALNRVVAGSASRIDGQLGANGQVWLVNPNGVVFGRGSQVNVGGLVASTLDITNEDFNAGRQVFTRGAAQGGITNQGNITVADGGTLALLAPTVKNEGTLGARLGNVVLAGGDRITLQAGVDGRLQVAVDPATVRTLIENKGMVVADGGQVVMTSRAADTLSASVVSSTGTVQARTLENKEGRILLLGDMRHGEVNAAGTLQAGFVETSAASVVIDRHLQVTTEGGHWLIDPVDITIDQGKAGAIQNALASGNVTVTTADGGSNADWGGAVNETGWNEGNIHVNADIHYLANKLTLNADRNININAKIHVDGSGTLALNYGATAGDEQTNPLSYSELIVRGQVDFTNAGSGLLQVNGHGFEVIKSLAGLQGIGDSAKLGGRYALGGSIDARATAAPGWNGNGSAGFAPLGDESNPFTGTFDGLGHSITGLSINRPEQDYVGLIGYAQTATLRNVGLVDANVRGGNYVGALAGANESRNGGTAQVSNAYASGQVAGTQAVGGLVGWNYGNGTGAALISASHASTQVRGIDAVGGLVGLNRAIGGAVGNIDDAYAVGAVDGGQYVGGLVGRNQVWGLSGTLISRAHATGQVTGKEGYAGGLVGFNEALGGGIQIFDSYATGQVSGTGEYFGGLVGYNYSGSSGFTSLWSVYASGNVIGAGGHVGGLVGYQHSENGRLGERMDGGIANAYATGNVSGTGAYVGGLVGHHRHLATSPSISQTYATGNVSGAGLHVGGLIGLNEGIVDKSFYATTDASGNGINGFADAAGQGKALSQLRRLSTFEGWSMDDMGGTGQPWRIYDSFTTPLLRSFLQGVTVTIGNGAFNQHAYTGSVATGAVAVPHSDITTNVPGFAVDRSLNYSTSGTDAGTYNTYDRTLSVGGLFSHQQGYDIKYDGQLVIRPAVLTVTASGTKVYGDSYDFNDLKYSIDGLVNNETLGELTWASPGADAKASVNNGYGHAITVDATTGGTHDPKNYSFNYLGTGLTVTPRPLTFTVSDVTKVYGDTHELDGIQYTYTGLADNETIETVLWTSEGAPAGASVKGGPYAITALAAMGQGLDDRNYQFSYINGRLTVAPRELTVAAGSATKEQGSFFDLSTIELAVEGLVNRESVDNVKWASVGAAADAAARKEPYAVTLSGAEGDGFDASNYKIRYVDGGLTVTPKVLPDTVDDVGNNDIPFVEEPMPAIGWTRVSLLSASDVERGQWCGSFRWDDRPQPCPWRQPTRAVNDTPSAPPLLTLDADFIRLQ